MSVSSSVNSNHTEWYTHWLSPSEPSVAENQAPIVIKDLFAK